MSPDSTLLAPGQRNSAGAPAFVGEAGRALLKRFPPRTQPASWPMTETAANDVLGLIEQWPAHEDTRAVRRFGVDRLLRWLATLPGATWQERWQNSPAPVLGHQWPDALASWLADQGDRLRTKALRSGLLVLVVADVIRPDPEFLLLVVRSRHWQDEVLRNRDPDGFARLKAASDPRTLASPSGTLALTQVAVILLLKGGGVADITVGDCLELRSVELVVLRRRSRGRALFYTMLKKSGLFPADAPVTLRAFNVYSGQLSAEQLVDRYDLQCRPVRDLIVDYLAERQPALDYSSFDNLARTAPAARVTGADGVWFAALLGAAVVHLVATRGLERVRELPEGTPYTHLQSVWFFTAVLTVPLLLQAALIAISFTLEWLIVFGRRAVVHRKVFSAATVVLAVAAATLVLAAFYPATDGPYVAELAGPRSIAVIVLAGLAYRLVNYTLVVVAIASANPGQPARLALGHPSEQLIIAAAIGLGTAGAQLGYLRPWSAPLLLVTVLALHLGLLVPQFRDAARTDRKTGLVDPMWWSDMAQQEIDRARRLEGTVGVLMLDLDHFKAVNDTHGHPAGDAVLRAVADALRHAVRSYDLVGRLGGEEFAVLLPGITSAEITATADRLRAAIATLTVTTRDRSGAAITITGLTASVGAGTYPDTATELPPLLLAIDDALYRAKHAGPQPHRTRHAPHRRGWPGDAGQHRVALGCHDVHDARPARRDAVGRSRRGEPLGIQTVVSALFLLSLVGCGVAPGKLRARGCPVVHWSEEGVRDGCADRAAVAVVEEVSSGRGEARAHHAVDVLVD